MVEIHDEQVARGCVVEVGVDRVGRFETDLGGRDGRGYEVEGEQLRVRMRDRGARGPSVVDEDLDVGTAGRGMSACPPLAARSSPRVPPRR